MPAGSKIGSINISYINPAILANLGMAGLQNHGSGVLSDSFEINVQTGDEWFGVSVTFTAGVGTFNVLHSFTNGSDGGGPYAGLTMDKAGNLYGTTSSGGSAPVNEALPDSVAKLLVAPPKNEPFSNVLPVGRPKTEPTIDALPPGFE